MTYFSQLKSPEEVKAILDKVQHKVDRYQKLANQHPYGTTNFEHYDREYAKAIAQYNILLEVFK